MPDLLDEDAVVACADLAGRTGATGFEIGYLHDNVPVEDAAWYAHAQYRGARLTAENHRSPSAAAMALAERLLRGATCRCGKPVTLSSERRGCRWRLAGPRWEPGCDAPPVPVKGRRGDVAAMQRAMTTPRADTGPPTCGSCGTRYPRRVATRNPNGLGYAEECTPAEYEQHARAAGWRIQADGPGVMCPRCALPDPQLVAMCRELEESIGRTRSDRQPQRRARGSAGPAHRPRRPSRRDRR